MRRPYLESPHPIAFAHRGGAAIRPENTGLAFAHALSLGYRHVETDVRATADGALVLLHDPTVDRTTDGRGPVAAMSLAEVRALDAGHRHDPGGGYPFRGAGARIPTLEEALDLHADLRLNLEIKPRGPAVARALWERIAALRVEDRVLVAGAHGPTLRAFRRLSRGRVATSAAADEILAFWLAVRAGVWRLVRAPFDALQVPVQHRGLRVLDEAFVRAAHARGLHVHAWTIDAPRVMAHLLALGVDALMTDRPDLLDPTTGAPRPDGGGAR